MREKEYTAKQKEMFGIYRDLYALTVQNGYEKSPLLTERVTLYMNLCRTGEFDLKDTLGAENMEFLVMAYYGLLGVLPDEGTVARWGEKKNLPEDEFRRGVMEAMRKLPELVQKGVIIRNDVYTAPKQTGRAKQSLKQKLLMGGYQLSRRLPLSVKVPLKKLAMKLLMR